MSFEFASTDLTQHLYHFAKKGATFITEDPKKKAAAAATPPATTPATPPATPPASPAEA